MISTFVIFGIAVIAALFFFTKLSDSLWKGLCAGLIACSVLSFFNQAYLVDAGFFGFGVLAWLSFIRAVFQKKWFLATTAFLTALLVSANLFLYDFYDQISWIMALPLVLMVVTILTRRSDKEEQAVMILLTAFTLVAFANVLFTTLN